MLKRSVSALTLFVVTLISTARRAAERPNIVVIMADAWITFDRDVDRAEGNALKPVRDTLTPLSFQKDTWSGAVNSEE
tara:strand:+ start:331 stop:564 length:234 start_codon:yes stop_codon:yes gene_type:complete